jgi:hypothetical protein
MHQPRKVTLTLEGEYVVADPSVIGVETGDIVEFKSKEGEPDNKYDPPNAVHLDQREKHIERITVLQVPFDFYCRLIINGKEYTYEGDGGIGLPDPPTVTMINPSQVAQGSQATQITVTGSDFFDVSKGLVNGQERPTQVVGNTSLVVTVTAADLVNGGTLEIAVKNETPSNWLPLTVA